MQCKVSSVILKKDQTIYFFKTSFFPDIFMHFFYLCLSFSFSFIRSKKLSKNNILSSQLYDIGALGLETGNLSDGSTSGTNISKLYDHPLRKFNSTYFDYTQNYPYEHF